MGIKGLWTILTPYSEKKSLYEIRGETLAVDLSGWVCDSQNVTDYYIQPKLYLRNLFFRTSYLLLTDVNPIFVLEGDAPELKRDVMAARNAIQFRGTAPRTDTARDKLPDVGRKRFKGILRELVDAVVSQDSDCFAYGARRVYRNFSVSSAAGGGAVQGSIDCYDADNMFKSNGFGRNKMVALALLCGCDYGAGACGSSITTAVSFLHTVPDSDIISRLLSWVSDPAHYEERTRWASAPGRCDRCGHVGRTHLKNGCPVCATHRSCEDLGHKSKVMEVKRELSLRSRALSSGIFFPEPRVMSEFLETAPKKIGPDSLKRSAPSLIQFMKLMTHKLDWSERYCVEKFLPLLTKWHLQPYVPCRTIKPIMIKKKRNPRGIPSFEVVWSDIDGEYEALIPDEQFEENEDPFISWTTTERQELMRQFYPQLVESYEESIKKPPKVKKVRVTKKTDKTDIVKPKRTYNKKVKKLVNTEIANLSGSLKNLDLTCKVSEPNSSKANVSVCINKIKRKLKSTKKGKCQKTIDSFIAKRRRKSIKKAVNSLRCSFNNISIVKDANDLEFDALCDNKENLSGNKCLWNLSNISSGNISESDLSDLIDKIVTGPPTVAKTVKVENKLVKLIFDNKFQSTPTKSRKSDIMKEIHNYCSTPKDSPKDRQRKNFPFPLNNTNVSLQSKVNTSYFFDKLTEDRDAFEMSVEYNHTSAVINLDCDTTVEYSLPDVCL